MTMLIMETRPPPKRIRRGRAAPGDSPVDDAGDVDGEGRPDDGNDTAAIVAPKRHGQRCGAARRRASVGRHSEEPSRKRGCRGVEAESAGTSAIAAREAPRDPEPGCSTAAVAVHRCGTVTAAVASGEEVTPLSIGDSVTGPADGCAAPSEDSNPGVIGPRRREHPATSQGMPAADGGGRPQRREKDSLQTMPERRNAGLRTQGDDLHDDDGIPPQEKVRRREGSDGPASSLPVAWGGATATGAAGQEQPQRGCSDHPRMGARGHGCPPYTQPAVKVERKRREPGAADQRTNSGGYREGTEHGIDGGRTEDGQGIEGDSKRRRRAPASEHGRLGPTVRSVRDGEGHGDDADGPREEESRHSAGCRPSDGQAQAGQGAVETHGASVGDEAAHRRQSRTDSAAGAVEAAKSGRAARRAAQIATAQAGDAYVMRSYLEGHADRVARRREKEEVMAETTAPPPPNASMLCGDGWP